MTKQGSQQFSWKLHGIPPNKRVCSWCGEKMKVGDVGWVVEIEDGEPVKRIGHFDCGLAALRKTA